MPRRPRPIPSPTSTAGSALSQRHAQFAGDRWNDFLKFRHRMARRRVGVAGLTRRTVVAAERSNQVAHQQPYATQARYRYRSNHGSGDYASLRQRATVSAAVRPAWPQKSCWPLHRRLPVLARQQKAASGPWQGRRRTSAGKLDRRQGRFEYVTEPDFILRRHTVSLRYASPHRGNIG